MGLALGLALSGALRWGPRRRPLRAVLVPVGLNLAAVALVGGVLSLGPTGTWTTAPWVVLGTWAGCGAGVGTAAFRWPRAVGLPLALLLALTVVEVSSLLGEFRPAGQSGPSARVQPLSTRDLPAIFAWTVDRVRMPILVPGLAPVLERARAEGSAPADWWWSWAAAQGWARSDRVTPPPRAVLNAVYRLGRQNDRPVWQAEAADLR